MAGFDTKTLEHLKKLCRIDCDPDEEANILDSLKRMLSYVEQLEEVNTDGIKPCNYVLRSMLKNVWREDLAENTMPREQFLSNAPDQIGGMLRIPPVMKPL